MAAARPDVSYTTFDLLDVTTEQTELVRTMYADIVAKMISGALRPMPGRAANSSVPFAMPGSLINVASLCTNGPCTGSRAM